LGSLFSFAAVHQFFYFHLELSLPFLFYLHSLLIPYCFPFV
jgi:hypothetical protein